MNDSFALHARLSSDCIEIAQLPLSVLLLMNNSLLPWCILVPRRADVTEIHMLSEADQHQLIAESSALSRFMLEEFAGDKMNVAVLGNTVPQLHLHHVVRYQNDPAWPGPVWGRLESTAYTDDKRDQMLGRFNRFVVN